MIRDYEVDEEIGECDEVELAFHHVVTFVVTFERRVENYDDLMDDYYYPQWMMMTMNHHLKLH